MNDAGWANILDQGEIILWQGRPDADPHITNGSYLMIAAGLGSFAAAGF